MLETSKISHVYKGTQRFEFPEVICQSNQTLLVIGPSGVGKTTLLHVLGGILKPLEGNVRIDKQSLYEMSGNRLDKFRGQNIGIVFQKPHFVQAISAEENLLLAQKLSTNKTNKDQVKGLLERLNLEHRAHSRISTMSQGELQRLSIARSIINRPKLILADEPTSALDDNNCKEVIQLLDQQSKELNAALIIVTHDNRLKQYFNDHIELS